jgi:drug/metabolite transporter (DMT)-like permease
LIIQFSLLVPFSLSIVVYRESLQTHAILGIVLIFSSIVFFALGKRSTDSRSQIERSLAKRAPSRHSAPRETAIPDARTWVFLALSSLFSGIGISMPRIYVVLNPAGGAFTLAFYQGLTLILLSGAALLLRRRAGRSSDFGGILLIGLTMGVTAVPANAFIALALRELRGAIVYPLRSVVNVLCVFVLSFLLFRERIRPLDAVGSLLAVAGIVLVSASLS